ncbi:MAG: hypothetical protein NW220_19990 [Leptolyngbyaceae cyanobacterium bins.349]|nr:hypothetical protein [Leptolyngbyaceae cyanobacterium bins.349]
MMQQIWLFTGLVTFSGFMFSFGYACQLAYFGKEFQSSYKRMLMTAVKPLIAFYISGMYWRAFVDKDFSLRTLLRILVLKDIPPFSEFLVSFSLVILVSLLFFNQIQYLMEKKSEFWIVCLLLLLTTFVPYQLININQMGLLIGTDKFPTYPVVQYFPLFLLGAYFAKHKIVRDRRVFVVSLSGLIAFLIFYLPEQVAPSRFPPSLLWIMASLFLVYSYYQIARRLSTQRVLNHLLSTWGKNVLFYLLISNILIFTFRGAYQPVLLHPIASFGLTVLMLLTITFLTTIVAVPKPAIVPVSTTKTVEFSPQEVNLK